jgi:aspartate carbamoyltransferase catalytic subunit
MTSTIFPRPHLLAIADLPLTTLETLLTRTARFADHPDAATLHHGKSVVNLFYENSTRTRTSFEIAAKKLGMGVINIDIATSSVKKGESLADTVRTIDAMDVDAIIIRHETSGAPQQVAEWVNCAVINAGDGTNEHPTQALLDARTILQRKGKLAGLKVAICGDILHSRVARSNLHFLSKFGVDLHVIAPSELMPDDKNLPPLTRHTDLATGIRDADVVMMLRLQLERMDKTIYPDLLDYQTAYRLDRAKLSGAKPDAIVMHPGPLNRMVEITDDVADDPHQSVILTQVKNGVFARMAVLDLLLTR